MADNTEDASPKTLITAKQLLLAHKEQSIKLEDRLHQTLTQAMHGAPIQGERDEEVVMALAAALPSLDNPAISAKALLAASAASKISMDADLTRHCTACAKTMDAPAVPVLGQRGR